MLAILTLIPVWRCLFLGETIGAWDEVATAAPWNRQAQGPPWDVLQADSVLQFYGWRDQVFDAWGTGHMPLWNHKELGGTPLLANSQSGGFYPPHMVMGWLHVPTGIAMAILVWLHLFIAACGVYVLSRGLGGGRGPALLAGVTFGLSPFLVAWAALPSVIETCAWIPWLLVGIFMLPERRSVVILGCSVALILLAGHLQFAAYGMVAAVIALLFRVIQARGFHLKVALYGALAFAIGGMLAAPQLLPVLAAGKHSHRQTTATADGFAAYSAGALPAWQMLSLPDASLLGLPTSSLDVKGNTLNGYWPALIQRGGNFAESAVAIGPVALWLLIMGFRKRRESWSLAVIGLVGLLLALGTFLGAILYFGVPGWAATGSPGRAGVLLVFALCALCGAWNPDSELLDRTAVRNRTAIYLGVVILCLGILARWPFSSWIPGLSQEDLHSVIPISALAGKALLEALIVAGLGAVVCLQVKYRPVAIGAMAVLAALLPGAFLVRSSPFKISEEYAGLDRVAMVNSQWDLLVAPKAVMPPNTAGLAGLHELGGYDSIISATVRDRLADIDGEDPAPAANGNMMFIKPKFDAAKLADAGVTQVWSLQRLPQLEGTTPAPSDNSGIFKYPLAGPGRASMSSGPATFAHESTEGFEIEATGPGTLTVRDNLGEGWTCSIDDQHPAIAYNTWPQVEVPKGRHTIHFSYSPPGLNAGLYTCTFGVLVLAVYAALTRRKLA